MSVGAQSGEHQNRHIGEFAKPSADTPTINTRHHNIDNDQIGPVDVKLSQPFHAIGGSADLRATLGQGMFYHAEHQGVVVDDQDSLALHVAYSLIPYAGIVVYGLIWRANR
jgi:hypothetical protein